MATSSFNDEDDLWAKQSADQLQVDEQSGVERIGDRIRDRIDGSNAPPDRRPPRQSCLGAGLTFMCTVCVAFVVFVVSCTSSCRPRLFRSIAEENSMSQSQGFVGVVGVAGVSPRSTHAYDTTTGGLIRSTANGEGFAIEWKTPVQQTGAVTEEVLDAVLSRMQSMQKTSLGGDGLARHIFTLDKLIEEMRQGDFSKLERSLGSRVGASPGSPEAPTGAGFTATPDGVGGLGSESNPP